MFDWLKNNVLWLIALSLGLFVGVLLLVPETNIESTTSKPRALSASVVSIAPQQKKIELEVPARMRPMQVSEIRSLVSGRVQWINSKFRNGSALTKGTLLIHLDDTELNAQLQSAKLNLIQAKMNLLEQQREAARASKNWQRINDSETTDPLVSRQVHVDLALQEVATAEALVAQAQLQLSYTKITMPFDGEVSRFAVADGAWVSPDMPLALASAVFELEAEAQLSESQWRRLKQGPMSEARMAESQVPESQIREAQNDIGTDKKSVVDTVMLSAWVIDDQKKPRWPLKLSHISQSVTEGSQLQSIFFRYSNNLTASQLQNESRDQLLAGHWVIIRMQGDALDYLWPVPQSAVTRDGFIWFVDALSCLQKAQVQNVFMTDTTAYVKLPAITAKELAIVEYPQSYFIVGREIEIKSGVAE